MGRPIIFPLATLICLYLVNPNSAAQALNYGELKKVSTVTRVCLDINTSKPPQLVIQTVGTVPTSGWKNGMLIPWIYVVQPIDGVQDFSFVAESPTGPAPQVISEIKGAGLIAKESWIKGVSVHASDGKSITAMLSDKKCGTSNS